jgi:hypothetical protein
VSTDRQLVAHLRHQRVPMQRLLLAEQLAQVLEPKGRRTLGGIEQARQPGVVLRPAVAIDGLALKAQIELLGHPGGRPAMAGQEGATDAVQGRRLLVPMRPVALGLHQAAEQAALGIDQAHLNGVAAAPEAAGLDVDECRECHAPHGRQAAAPTGVATP